MMHYEGVTGNLIKERMKTSVMGKRVKKVSTHILFFPKWRGLLNDTNNNLKVITKEMAIFVMLELVLTIPSYDQGYLNH